MAVFRLLPLVNISIISIAMFQISNAQCMKSGSLANGSFASSSDVENPSYVVIIDAGSTGSRVSAFTFHTSRNNGQLMLDDELYAQTEPGLSSFANNPRDGMKTLEELIAKAKDIIPRSAWSHTPISLKATAGLRLLPKDQADGIIDECKRLIDTSGFRTTNNCVSIMDGTDEGIYAWFTVSFLFGTLSSQTNANTAAVLDLGGGSTQVTYLPDEDDLKILDNKDINERKVFNHSVRLYTHSLLGMGIMAARKSILTDGLDDEAIDSDEVVEVRSECINPMVSANWSYGGIHYLVKGPVNDTSEVAKTSAEEDRPSVRLTKCLEIIRKFVNNVEEKPVGLNKHDIYGINYYFDRAAEAGLIDPSTGGVITLDDFYKAAVDTCKNPNPDHPFLYLDIAYIYVLLHDGFGLENSTKLHLYQTYQGHGLSWSLGAAINLLDSELQ